MAKKKFNVGDALELSGEPISFIRSPRAYTKREQSFRSLPSNSKHYQEFNVFEDDTVHLHVNNSRVHYPTHTNWYKSMQENAPTMCFESKEYLLIEALKDEFHKSYTKHISVGIGRNKGIKITFVWKLPVGTARYEKKLQTAMNNFIRSVQRKSIQLF